MKNKEDITNCYFTDKMSLSFKLFCFKGKQIDTGTARKNFFSANTFLGQINLRHISNAVRKLLVLLICLKTKILLAFRTILIIWAVYHLLFILIMKQQQVIISLTTKKCS